MFDIPTQLAEFKSNCSPRKPHRAHESDAAFDLVSNERVDIAPGDRALVGTGISLALPPKICGLILPRSGLAIKHGLTVLNAPGLIDPGYRGEIKVPLIHLGLRMTQFEHAGHWNQTTVEPYVNIYPGDRIAQLLLVRFENASFSLRLRALSESDRGNNGFGSTGV